MELAYSRPYRISLLRNANIPGSYCLEALNPTIVQTMKTKPGTLTGQLKALQLLTGDQIYMENVMRMLPKLTRICVGDYEATEAELKAIGFK